MAPIRALRTLIASGVVALALIAPGASAAPPSETSAGATAPSRPLGPDDSRGTRAGGPLDSEEPGGTKPGPDESGGTAHGKPPGPEEPRPPLLPADFRGTGRYIVRDLGIDVPFTWQGRNGDSQMIAGGPEHPIWFTNLIYRNTLYTLTYKWPNIPLDPPRPCDRVGFFNRQMFNDLLKTARFVGPEILQGKPDRRVDHWRVGVVGGFTQPGEVFRFPIALGDVYVDQRNPSQWWQVLQFGFQNLFDPALDEWFTMRTFAHQPGQVTLPDRCPPPL
ncbi:hypothetical protein [Micromonospora sp. NPDC051006]|uniref:hypothetical protein n=1 Tax=Micromonospora sp. NPDC051006 TaxID=3364283 RepID=UPI0037AB799D